jgi:hypothetical protein
MPDTMKREDAKLTENIGPGMEPNCYRPLAKQGSETSQAAYTQADLRGLLEKVTLNPEQAESGYFKRYGPTTQPCQASAVSVLSTSKLANQAAPKVTCAAPYISVWPH